MVYTIKFRTSQLPDWVIRQAPDHSLGNRVEYKTIFAGTFPNFDLSETVVSELVTVTGIDK
jgi:hypothetical protein